MSHVLNVGEILTVNAQLHPERVAVKDLRRSLTCAQLEERANRLANAFAGLGLGKGDRVAIYAHNCLEWMEIYAACAKSGVVAVPVNFRLAAPEIRYIIEDCGAAVLLVGADLVDVVGSLRASLPLRPAAYVQIGGERLHPGFRDYEDLLSFGSPRRPRTKVRPEDVWTLMYTSGTTGRPKGAIRSHQSYVLFYLLNAIEFGFNRDDVGLAVMPMCHVNSVFYGFVFTYLGGTVCVYDRRSFDPEHLLRVMSEQRITFTSLVPTHYTMMLDLPGAVRGAQDLRHVSKLLISSAPARRETKLSIMECFPSSRLFEAYGSTEAGLVTLLRPEQQFEKLGSIGREIVGTARVKLLDAEGLEVPEGEVGELFARTPTAFDGYWNNPQATERAFFDGYCSAGDLARRDGDGFYTLVDRKSNMIITGGEKVYPSEVEQVLGAHPDVGEVAVIGVPDLKWGETVTAVVVPRDGASPTVSAIVEFARAQLAGYKVPRQVTFLRPEEMPRTATGKLLHRVLRDRVASASAARREAAG
ncbi:MAG TPA: AMP-binding protein [Anaeromyxobacteraceae bacterium]|nr:AMP-binding protein [Anaeromyxobacteraceae bacterium]